MGVDTKDGCVEVGGLRIHCLEAGEGNSPVLLLHGGGYDSGSLSYGLSTGPISRHHKVFVPDWPGYGHSDKPEATTYSTEYYVDVLECLMEALGLNKASLVGVSMGGAISLGLSLRSPGRVDKLVLVDSHGLGGDVPWWVISYPLVQLPLLNKGLWAILGRSRTMIRWSLDAVFHDPQNVTEGLVDEIYQLMKEPGASRAWRAWQRDEIRLGGLRTNFVDRLHELAVPTLILHGAEDGFVPVSWARRAHERIEDSELRIFPECGHWLPREKPDEFVCAVLDFLARK